MVPMHEGQERDAGEDDQVILASEYGGSQGDAGHDCQNCTRLEFLYWRVERTLKQQQEQRERSECRQLGDGETCYRPHERDRQQQRGSEHGLPCPAIAQLQVGQANRDQQQDPIDEACSGYLEVGEWRCQQLQRKKKRTGRAAIVWRLERLEQSDLVREPGRDQMKLFVIAKAVRTGDDQQRKRGQRSGRAHAQADGDGAPRPH